MAPLTERVRVVLVSPRNPLNIGAAARAMSNFGFFDLRLVDAYEVAYQEARSAVNAAAVLQASRQYASVAEAVADCVFVAGTASLGSRDPEHMVRRLESGARVLREQAACGPVALLFGSEKFGLSNEDLSHCHLLLRIPTRAEHESMNLGQAVAVCLYELIRDEQAMAVEPPLRRVATGEQEERLTGLLHEALDLSGYVNPKTAGSTELKLRRMVHRLKLGTRDAELWLGMVRQMLWRLRHPDAPRS